jgi:ribose transport system substrate-binding protein
MARCTARVPRLAVVAAVLGLLLAACEPQGPDTPDPSATEPEIGTHAIEGEGAPTPAPQPARSSARDSEWFDEEEFDRQLALRRERAEGPADEPWLQHLPAELVDTSPLARPRPYHLCFSDAGAVTSWHAVGWTTMQAEVDLHDDVIASFTAVDARGDEEAQLADIQSLVTGGECDLLIIAPVSAALTPAVQQACEQVPVIVFERQVDTDCPVTSVRSIGSYAFGADGAEFLAGAVPEGGTVLAVPTNGQLELHARRRAAAQVLLEEQGVQVQVTEPTGGDATRAAEIVVAHLEEGTPIDGVWSDTGSTAAAVIDAFNAAGVPVPPISGEDQLELLTRWHSQELTAVAPTQPAYQWRTPIIAALRVLEGQPVPTEWVLPQPTIGEVELDRYVREDLPGTHHALCGCEALPGFPDRWR